MADKKISALSNSLTESTIADADLFVVVDMSGTKETKKITRQDLKQDMMEGTLTTAAQGAITSVGTLTGLTMGGELGCADNLVSRPVIKDYAETVHTGGVAGASVTLDETNGNVQTFTMTASTTSTFTMPSGSGLQAGTSLTLILTQDGVTGSGLGVFTGVKWSGGTAVTLSTAASSIDIVTFITFNGGASPVWHGFSAGLAMA